MRPQHFEKQKSASLSHQLIKAGRYINEKGLAAVKEQYKLPALKQSHLDLFPFIDFEGTSISRIARRKGVSKQAVSKVVKEMVDMGILIQKPSPDDSRSKLVFFKTSGPYSIQKGFAALESIDLSLKNSLGEKSYKVLLNKITGLLETIEGFDNI